MVVVVPQQAREGGTHMRTAVMCAAEHTYVLKSSGSWTCCTEAYTGQPECVLGVVWCTPPPYGHHMAGVPVGASGNAAAV